MQFIARFYFCISVLYASLSFGTAHAAPVVIDYAVFYTPNAKIRQGGSASIQARIQKAFSDANEIFSLSGSEITHNIVHIEELPINNTSETLPELGTELALGFNFAAQLTQSQADSSVTVVEFQRPGGFAIIPSSRRQALSGGNINIGLPNLSGTILAHEIGHTLGSVHDYADTTAAFFDLLPDYGAGNHFIGANTGLCYRTIMSALLNCRVPGYAGQLALESNRFSSSRHYFEGTLTGNATKADNVGSFEYFGPLVASARGISQLPIDSIPTPSPTPSKGDGDNDGDDPEQGGENMPDSWDMLTLKLVRSNRQVIVRGQCINEDSSALKGDKITISKINKKSASKTRIKQVTCKSNGKFQAIIKQKGIYQAKNNRTGRESESVTFK